MFGLAVCAGLCLPNTDQIYCKSLLFYQIIIVYVKVKTMNYLLPFTLNMFLSINKPIYIID